MTEIKNEAKTKEFGKNLIVGVVKVREPQNYMPTSLTTYYKTLEAIKYLLAFLNKNCYPWDKATRKQKHTKLLFLKKPVKMKNIPLELQRLNRYNCSLLATEFFFHF